MAPRGSTASHEGAWECAVYRIATHAYICAVVYTPAERHQHTGWACATSVSGRTAHLGFAFTERLLVCRYLLSPLRTVLLLQTGSTRRVRQACACISIACREPHNRVECPTRPSPVCSCGSCAAPAAAAAPSVTRSIEAQEGWCNAGERGGLASPSPCGRAALHHDATCSGIPLPKRRVRTPQASRSLARDDGLRPSRCTKGLCLLAGGRRNDASLRQPYNQ